MKICTANGYSPAVPAKNLERQCQTPPAQGILIVTKSKAIVEWLRRHGITGQVTERASRLDVAGRHVIAHTLPFPLAIRAASVSWVDAPGVTLMTATADDLDLVASKLITVTVWQADTPACLKIK